MLAELELNHRPAPQLSSEQEQALLLALRETPLYQAARPPGPAESPSALELLARLPLITKEEIRRNFPKNFLGPDAELSDLADHELIELEHTSGTSETRVPLLLPRGWWLLQERKALEQNALVRRALQSSEHPRRVSITSPVCSGEICYSGVPSRDDRVLGDALYVNLSRYPFLWSPADLARMAAEAREWQPLFLDVDPVYGVLFARYCEEQKIRLPSLRFILASYEFVSVAHRRLLERAFGVPVFNLYGATETGQLLMQDETGAMRPSPETALLELRNMGADGIGDLVVSTLTNPFMPLLHYRIGDLVEPRASKGREAFIVHGRAADCFESTSGRRVTSWQLDQCFEGLAGFVHYQLHPMPESRWQLRYVPEKTGPTKATLDGIKERVEALLELPDQLELLATDLFVPEGSGKFKLGYPKRKR